MLGRRRVKILIRIQVRFLSYPIFLDRSVTESSVVVIESDTNPGIYSSITSGFVSHEFTSIVLSNISTDVSKSLVESETVGVLKSELLCSSYTVISDYLLSTVTTSVATWSTFADLTGGVTSIDFITAITKETEITEVVIPSSTSVVIYSVTNIIASNSETVSVNSKIPVKEGTSYSLSIYNGGANIITVSWYLYGLLCILF